MLDPLKNAETPAESAVPQQKSTRRMLACLHCSRVWEADPKTIRPQCYSCKRTRTREATPEEIAAYDKKWGTSSDTTADQRKSTADNAESTPNQQKSTSVNAESTADQQSAQRTVEKVLEIPQSDVDTTVDVVALVDPKSTKITKKQQSAQHHQHSAQGTSPLLFAGLFIGIASVIAVLAYLAYRSRGTTEPSADDFDNHESISELPTKSPVGSPFAGLPGMS